MYAMTERKKSRQQLAVMRLTSKKFQTVFVIAGGRMRFSPRMPAAFQRRNFKGRLTFLWQSASKHVLSGSFLQEGVNTSKTMITRCKACIQTSPTGVRIRRDIDSAFELMAGLEIHQQPG